MKILCCGACIVGVLELLAATNVSYTAAESAYRDSYLAQPAQEEDGRRRPVVKHGTWYLDGKPVFWIGGWLHGNRTADWPKGNPDRQGIGHFAYSIPPGKELFDRIGFNSSQISHAPVQAGKALMGLPLGDRKRKFDQVEAEDADFIRGFGDVPMVVDFAYGFAAEIPEDVRKRTDQVTSWWHLFVPFCPENPEGVRYYESYFLGGTRTLMRYGMNVFIYELFNESSYMCACRDNILSFAQRMKRKYGTIAAANAQWGTDFANFRDVASQKDFVGRKGAYYDWCLFLGDRYVEILRQGRLTIRRADRRSNVYFTEQSASEPPHRPGIDYRKVAKEMDVMTLEGGWRYGKANPAEATGGEAAVAAESGDRHMFTLDFYRALSKDLKPIMNNEHYCGRFEDGVRVPSRREDFLTSFWLETMHGVSGSFTYNYDKRNWEWKTADEAKGNLLKKANYKSYSLLNPYAMPPENLDVFALFQKELEPYRDRLMPMPRTRPATVAVLFSYPALWRAKAKWNRNEAVARTCDWYMRLLEAQVPVKVVFDEDVAHLGSEVEWLVLPAASRCADETVAAMRAFVARGGRIAAAPDALEKTVWEKDREKRDRPPMTVFETAEECMSGLLSKRVTRWAILSDAENGLPVEADVQVCDRGDFKLVCCAALKADHPQKVRLQLALGGGRYRMRIIPDESVRTVDLSSPIEFVLKPQERRVMIFQR